MAFAGMFLMFAMVVIVVLGICALVCAVCFIVSGIIMHVKRKKVAKGEKVAMPWYVILLRVVGTLASLPLVFTVCIFIWASIENSLDKSSNLARAVAHYDYERAEKILEKGENPNIEDDYGRTPLMCIVAGEDFIRDGEHYYFSEHDSVDDFKMMELLVRYGADVNCEISDCGYDELHKATDEYAIYANSIHRCGNTPLIYAVRYGSPEMVSFLIDNGADVNEANACGFTPILMCADSRSDDDGGPEILRILRNAGANPHAVTNFGQDIGWLICRRVSIDDCDQMSAIVDEYLLRPNN